MSSRFLKRWEKPAGRCESLFLLFLRSYCICGPVHIEHEVSVRCDKVNEVWQRISWK